MKKSSGQKKLDALNEIFMQPEISEFIGNKREFKKRSMAFLRQLLKDVGQYLSDQLEEPGIAESKVSFNPGGPAIAGDPSLFFITRWGNGVAVYICGGRYCGLDPIMYRTIKSMKDYTGGNNQWQSANVPYDEIVRTIALCAHKYVEKMPPESIPA